MKLLILRPPPGADETAERATALGLEPVVAPLFAVRAVDWDAPDPAGIEAVLLTSANAARHAGEQLEAFVDLPCYAVGHATAAAAREAGFGDLRQGPSDGAAVIALMAQDGIVHALHLSGRDHIALQHPATAITRRVVYAAEAAEAMPPAAREAVRDGALAMLHSPRAAQLFAMLIDADELARERIAVAAISEAAAAAAGHGWKSKAVAAEPRDHALLELAAKLCHISGGEMGKGG